MAAQAKALPKIGRGKRALIAGQTGSGKSTLANWLLKRSPGHWVIINPKWTASYKMLPESTTLKFNGPQDYGKLEREMLRSRFVVVEPSSHAADMQTLDDILMHLHDNYRDVGVCVDELYSMHNNGRAGDGLLGWLTRGRELGQSFLGLTQRPAWISQFLFSESDYVGGMKLRMEKDRKRLADMTGLLAFERELPKHHWLWFDGGKSELRRFGPVPLDTPE